MRLNEAQFRQDIALNEPAKTIENTEKASDVIYL
jgi:hypothetical protein